MTISNFTGKYKFLSNFYRSRMIIDGKMYKTMEHYYQSMKTVDGWVAKKIRFGLTPAHARRMGRECYLRDDWKIVKVGIMRKGLMVKFEDTKLRQLLLETGDEKLVKGNW